MNSTWVDISISRGGEAAFLRLLGLGEERADRVVEAEVGGRVGTRRSPDRRLIDVDHIADVLAAGEFVVGTGEDSLV